MSWVRLKAIWCRLWYFFLNYLLCIDSRCDWSSKRLPGDVLIILSLNIHRGLNSDSLKLISRHNYYRRIVIVMPNEVKCYPLDMSKVNKYADMPADTAPPLVYISSLGLVDGAHRLYAARYRGDQHLVIFIPDDFDERNMKL